MPDLKLEDGHYISEPKPFPEKAQALLDALYLAHPRQPKTGEEKIGVLESILGCVVPGFPGNPPGLLRAYEFVYLTKQGILE
jgi:hypothetical protein